MKDYIARVANALSVGATAENIHHMLVGVEGMSEYNAYLTYKAAELLLKSRESDLKASCICTPGDPCDYHAATCVTCPNGCVGHP